MDKKTDSHIKLALKGDIIQLIEENIIVEGMTISLDVWDNLMREFTYSLYTHAWLTLDELITSMATSVYKQTKRGIRRYLNDGEEFTSLECVAFTFALSENDATPTDNKIPLEDIEDFGYVYGKTAKELEEAYYVDNLIPHLAMQLFTVKH